MAQSSKSHECYLRHWAKEVQVPILSIDYSLAPEAPYPRAHEEVTYVYAWVLKNYHLLGSTGVLFTSIKNIIRFKSIYLCYRYCR